MSTPKTRPAREPLLEIMKATQEALWAGPTLADAERLLAERGPLIEEATHTASAASTRWSAEEETLVRRIATLDRELMIAVRAPHVDAFEWMQRRQNQREMALPRPGRASTGKSGSMATPEGLIPTHQRSTLPA